jgi:hypothetical protein
MTPIEMRNKAEQCELLARNLPYQEGRSILAGQPMAAFGRSD